MLEKDVVTCFIINEHNEYLILERSDNVRTNKLRWATISGTLDGKSPYEQAFVELWEELRLGDGDIEYKGRSIPFDPHFEERNIKVRLISPLLFLVKNPERITTNWEHTGRLVWITKPNDLDQYNTVPMLKETLEALLYQLIEPWVDERIADIQSDKTHGANQLTKKALETMKLATQVSRARCKKEFSTYIKFIGRALAETRPSMVSIHNSINFLLHQIDEYNGLSWRDFTVQKIDQLVNDLALAQAKAAENASALIKNEETILTCSYSSTIIETFRLATKKGKTFKVIVAESRFNSRIYGTRMANVLDQLGVSVQVIPDSSIHNYVFNVQRIFVGADSVFSDGSILNGIPTLVIAKAAKNLRPLFIVCATVKFNIRPIEISTSENGLEMIHSDMITAIVTEKGVIKPEEVHNWIIEMEKLFILS